MVYRGIPPAKAEERFNQNGSTVPVQENKEQPKK